MRTSLLALILVSSGTSLADDVDPASLYELSTQGTTDKVKAGDKGKVVIEIRAKEGAHVSDQAPLRIELKGQHVKPEKEKLVFKDNLAPKGQNDHYTQARFEVPFAAPSAGKGQIDAKVVFFICTEKICARQQKQLSMPVEVQ